MCALPCTTGVGALRRIAARTAALLSGAWIRGFFLCLRVPAPRAATASSPRGLMPAALIRGSNFVRS